MHGTAEDRIENLSEVIWRAVCHRISLDARRHIVVRFAAVLVVLTAPIARGADFTFAVWSDTHFDAYDGGGYRENAVQDILALPGKAYPPQIGGVVGRIDFIMHPGDITDNTLYEQYEDNDGGTNDDFISCINRWFTVPVYEITGNHDTYNEPGATQIRAAITARHGSTSYSFDVQGVHFIGLDSGVNGSAEPLRPDAVTYLESHMPTLRREQAIILFSHYPPRDAPHPVWDRVYEIIQSYNVVVMCNGDVHYPAAAVWRGFDSFTTSDCKVVHGNQAFSVVHVTDTRLTAVAYDWYNNAWRTDALIDKAITGLGPRIAVDPERLSPVTTYGLLPPPEGFTITNSGGGVLHYSVTPGASWLTVQPVGGTSAGEADTIGVNYATLDLLPGDYATVITVSDPDASNSPATILVALRVDPVPGDFDRDNDVDQSDFGHLQACLTGPGIAQDDPACVDAKLDGDTDVDQNDFAVFQGCLSGANVPADSGCAD